MLSSTDLLDAASSISISSSPKLSKLMSLKFKEKIFILVF